MKLFIFYFFSILLLLEASIQVEHDDYYKDGEECLSNFECSNSGCCKDNKCVDVDECKKDVI